MPAMEYDNIAHLYDAYVRTDLDVPFFLREATQTKGPVLELMCGTGRVSLPLLEASIDLTCVDSSRAMLDVFRRKLESRGLSAKLIEQDVCHLSLDRELDLILIPFHSFAEIVEPDQQRQALRAIRKHLAPADRFICTLHNPPVRLQSVTGRRRTLGDFSMHDGRILSLSSTERCDIASGLVTGAQHYEVRNNAGATVWQAALDIRFCLHAAEPFEAMVRACGFEPVALYGDYECAPFIPKQSPFMIWVLRTA